MTVAGIILCGGRSTRMGTPKAALPFGPETMLQRVVRLLGTVVSPVVVVAAKEQDLPLLPADVIVTRDERDEGGPLEGLRAGLRALPETVSAAYVTGCDAPLLVPAFVTRMFELLGEDAIAIVEAGGAPHPLGAVYRKNVLQQVETLLTRRSAGPVHLLDTVPTRRVRPEEFRDVDPELLSLRNLNIPEDYRAALRDASLA